MDAKTRFRAVALVTLAFLALPCASHARQGLPPLSRSGGVAPLAAVDALVLPAPDVAALRVEDEKWAANGTKTFRFAAPIAVSVTPADFGTSERLADGSTLWRLRVHAPGATDLNFGFARYDLPAGATFHVTSETLVYFEGPYTADDNETHGQLWTPVVPGDRAVLELFVPEGARTPDLELVQVSYGYRDLFHLGRSHAERLPGSCNNDVICPVGDAWRDEIQSVNRYSISGLLLCSGQMVIDVPHTFRNLVLSANHCGVTPATAPSVVVYWNYESPSCGQLCCGSLSDNQSGAFYLASRADVDFLLFELDDDPSPGSNVYWAGWDAGGAVSQGSVGIHHPNGDPKCISFNTDALLTVNSCVGTGGQNSHWRVNDWEDGTTEPGSSGSGIWDPDSHRIVGTLSGGSAACPNNNGGDCYGKVSVAWEGAPIVARLQDHLDPEATGQTWADGAYRNAVAVGEGTAPPRLALEPPAPNPFTASASFGFELDAGGRVDLAVFDPSGRHVRTVVARELPAGRHRAIWDGRDGGGREVAAGVYLVRPESAAGTRSGTVSLVR